MTAYGFRIIRSKRKTISLEIQDDLSILVRAPYKAKDKDIQKFVNDRSDWIRKHLQVVKDRTEHRAILPKLTAEEINDLSEKAC